MRGVFLDSGTLGKDLDFGPLKATLPDWQFYENTSVTETVTRVQNAQIVVTNKVKLDEAIFAQSQIKCIAIAATGADHIDLVAAKARNIVVCNVKGYSTPSVIQHTIGLLIALASKIVPYDAKVKAGAWVNSPFFCLQDFQTHELAGKKLGIVGFGAIGQGVASIAQALGMELCITGRVPAKDRLPLATLLSEVDVLSLHCPLTKETFHMIDSTAIKQMKSGAMLINVSRGGLVDEVALADALRTGHIAGAAVDVVEGEPPKKESPLMAKDVPNLIVTPHVAWATTASRNRLLQEITINVQAFLDNKPRNRVI